MIPIVGTTYLVTGSAGFIGFHTAKKLLEEGGTVIGVDNFNDYYDQKLKEERNAMLEKFERFTLYRGELGDLDFVKKVLSAHKIDAICHLAAQAGIRFSLKEPYKYIQSNIVGFTNLINEAKNVGIRDFVYASSSSVYGATDKAIFSEELKVDQPLSLYAATKKANEAIAYTYHHLYGMHCTGLRFFTVYGPWGRPDMAIYSFTDAIVNDRPIQIFNHGDMRRDFTYVDDVVNGIIAALQHVHPYEIINLGNNNPVALSRLVELLEQEIGKSATKEFLPLQPGDVVETYADIARAKEKLGWQPTTSIEEGIKSFVDWYKHYYGNKE